MKTYEAMAGCHISSAAADMVALANESGESVGTRFNEIMLVAEQANESGGVLNPALLNIAATPA